MGKDRAVRVEQVWGCYCLASIGQLGLGKCRAGFCLARIAQLGLSKGRAFTVGTDRAVTVGHA